MEVCAYTKDKLRITEEFLSSIETRLLGVDASSTVRREFRRVFKRYTSKALTQEIMLEQKPVIETEIYKRLHERYVRISKKVLDPFLDNNFRRELKITILPISRLMTRE